MDANQMRWTVELVSKITRHIFDVTGGVELGRAEMFEELKKAQKLVVPAGFRRDEHSLYSWYVNRGRTMMLKAYRELAAEKAAKAEAKKAPESPGPFSEPTPSVEPLLPMGNFDTHLKGAMAKAFDDYIESFSVDLHARAVDAVNKKVVQELARIYSPQWMAAKSDAVIAQLKTHCDAGTESILEIALRDAKKVFREVTIPGFRKSATDELDKAFDASYVAKLVNSVLVAAEGLIQTRVAEMVGNAVTKQIEIDKSRVEQMRQEQLQVLDAALAKRLVDFQAEVDGLVPAWVKANNGYTDQAVADQVVETTKAVGGKRKARVKLPRVAIFGPKNDQKSILEREFKNLLDLRIENTLNPGIDVSNLDYILIWVNYVDHAVPDAMRHHPGYRQMKGGMTTIRNHLNKILEEFTDPGL